MPCITNRPLLFSSAENAEVRSSLLASVVEIVFFLISMTMNSGIPISQALVSKHSPFSKHNLTSAGEQTMRSESLTFSASTGSEASTPMLIAASLFTVVTP